MAPWCGPAAAPKPTTGSISAASTRPTACCSWPFTDISGNLLWISSARPGRSSEITTARHNKITTKLRQAGLGALADLGFVGLDDDPDHPVIITGRRASRHRSLTHAQRQANSLLNRERAAVEHGIGDLKNWRSLSKIRMNPAHATALLRALLVLTNLEITR